MSDEGLAGGAGVTCGVLRGYATREDAERAMRGPRTKGQRRRPATVYRCGECGQWHIRR